MRSTVDAVGQWACPQGTHSQRERFFTSWRNGQSVEIFRNFEHLPRKILKTLHIVSEEYLHPSLILIPSKDSRLRISWNSLFSKSKVSVPCKGDGAKDSTGTCRRIRKCWWWKSPVPCWLLPRNLEGWCTEHQTARRVQDIHSGTGETSERLHSPTATTKGYVSFLWSQSNSPRALPGKLGDRCVQKVWGTVRAHIWHQISLFVFNLNHKDISWDWQRC